MKAYHYSLLKILSDWWVIFAIPIMYFLVKYIAFPTRFSFLLIGDAFMVFFLLVPSVAVFLLLKSIIIMDEKAITRKLFSKEKKIKWEDIDYIERIRKYKMSFDEPKDLIIKSKTGVSVTVYGFLRDLNEAEKDIERYARRKIGTLKAYHGDGSIIHKSFFNWAYILFVTGLFCALIFYYYYHFDKADIIKYFSPFCIIFGLYLRYAHKKSNIKISLNGNGLTYEGAERHGIRFKKVSAKITWDSIVSVKTLNDEKGPIKIETVEADYLYWSSYDKSLNKIIVEEINNRIRK